jgi:hypothetical protein
VISSSQRPLPDNTRHSQQTNIHAPVGFEPKISAGERPEAVPSFFCFSSTLSFIFLVSLCPSVLRYLAVRNIDESVLCWCIVTSCISGFSFLSAYYTSFVIYTALAASNCIKPLPLYFLGTYKRSESDCG